jgi:hypothetical protein
MLTQASPACEIASFYFSYFSNEKKQQKQKTLIRSIEKNRFRLLGKLFVLNNHLNASI